MARGKPIPNVRIIDNKKVWVTPDEFRYYEEICKGYDRPNFNGKDLFQDHFEVNDEGIIIFVKPPHKKYSSMEVYTFLISLQVNQQLRLIQEQVSTLISEAETKFKEKLEEVSSLKWQIDEINELKDQLKRIETMQEQWKEVERLKEEEVKANSNKGHKTDDGRVNAGTEGSSS